MIKKSIIYIFNIPLYYLMYLIKPKKNLWIFGAWLGEKYFDNPKFLFEYIKNNNKNIQVIWITKDKNICNNIDILYKYSVRGVYCGLTGEVFIVTHSTRSDIYDFINHKSRKIIQLWHGIPIKKIGKDNSFIKKISTVKKSIFPFMEEQYSMVISSSLADQKNMSTAFNIDIINTKITGYPRNDILVKNISNPKKYKILYAPTLRDNINDEINLFEEYGFNINSFIDLLEKYNFYLDIKMHPANTIDSKFKASITHKRINFLESKIEINEIIEDYSILISDYSGIFVDYLLINKPIIFAPFDLKKYLTRDRELYYNYNEVTPGPQCKNWNNVLLWIEKFINNDKLYLREREILKNKFHQYQDGKNCERVYNEIISL